jgi:hypothetical protein
MDLGMFLNNGKKRRVLETEKLNVLQSELDTLSQSARSTAMPPREGKFFERTSVVMGLVQSLVTVSAVCVGGVWSWKLFDPLAELNPNLSLTQTVESRRITEDTEYLFVNVVLKNSSKRIFHLSCAEISVDRLLPVTQEQIEQLKIKAPLIQDENDFVPSHVKWHRDMFPEQTFIEANGEMQIPWTLVIDKRISSATPSLRLSTISVESAFQAGQPPACGCRLGSRDEMLGPSWAVRTISNLSEGNDK